MARQSGPRGFEMPEADPGDPASPPPNFTFASLVLSLSTSALMHLGLAPRGDDAAEEPPSEPNLPLARQVIDILEVLLEKTQGNLDDDEAKMLEQVLHDLHLRYVEKKKG